HAEFRKREFGVAFTEDDYRLARDACLRYRWLQVVDQSVVDGVQTLLRDDPVLLAVPTKATVTFGTIDFTPAGAAVYHMILAEWFGPDWEDRLRASNVHYWEEHLYCEAEAGFDEAFRFDREKLKAVRSRRVVPIGPWCVSWW